MVIWTEGDQFWRFGNKHEDGMGVAIFVFISILLVPTAIVEHCLRAAAWGAYAL